MPKDDVRAGDVAEPGRAELRLDEVTDGLDGRNPSAWPRAQLIGYCVGDIAGQPRVAVSGFLCRAHDRILDALPVERHQPAVTTPNRRGRVIRAPHPLSGQPDHRDETSGRWVRERLAEFFADVALVECFGETLPGAPLVECFAKFG